MTFAPCWNTEPEMFEAIAISTIRRTRIAPLRSPAAQHHQGLHGDSVPMAVIVVPYRRDHEGYDLIGAPPRYSPPNVMYISRNI